MINRRRFLGSLTAAGLARVATPDLRRGQNQWGAETGVPTLVNGSVQVTGSVVLPPPEESGIEHVVVVTMENRSFDTSWADSLLRTVCRRDSCTQIAKAFLIGPTLWRRISQAARILRRITPMTNPAWPTTMARWMASCAPAPMMSTPSVTIPKRTSPSTAQIAQNYLASDRYFASILGPTFPNRLFQWAAQTDRLDDSVTFSSLPTILDRLSEAGVSHRYFFTMSPSWRCGV